MVAGPIHLDRERPTFSGGVKQGARHRKGAHPWNWLCGLKLQVGIGVEFSIRDERRLFPAAVDKRRGAGDRFLRADTNAGEARIGRELGQKRPGSQATGQIELRLTIGVEVDL